MTALLALAVTATASPAQAAFPGTNGQIAYSSYPRGPHALEEIFVVKPNGRGGRQLTDSGGALISNVAPDWNRAGTKIALQHSKPTDSWVWIIRPRGRRIATLNDAACRYGIGRPAWSPDSRRIAYSCFDNHSTYIKTFEFATRTRTQITNGDFDLDSEFSPNGDAIAYSRFVDIGLGYNEIVVAFLDPTGHFDHEEVIAGGFSESVGSPDWNPSGTALAYGCAPLIPLGDSDICTAPIAGPHTETLLTAGGNPEFSPAFSPSGTRIVYAVGPEDGDTELKSRNLSLGPIRTITSNRVVDQQPDWGPK